jgi:hypothetical protein
MEIIRTLQSRLGGPTDSDTEIFSEANLVQLKNQLEGLDFAEAK